MSIYKLLLLFVIKTVVCLTEVEEKCVNTYTDTFNNDFLIGTWYEHYKFTIFGFPLPDPYCPTITVTRSNQTEVQRYEAAYRQDNPYSFSDNPVLTSIRGYMDGMFLGTKEAKFFIFDPNSVFYNENWYQVRVFRKVNDDYVIYHLCEMRGHVKWLMSRKRYPTDAELNEVLASIKSEVGNMDKQRFCANV